MNLSEWNLTKSLWLFFLSRTGLDYLAGTGQGAAGQAHVQPIKALVVIIAGPVSIWVLWVYFSYNGN